MKNEMKDGNVFVDFYFSQKQLYYRAQKAKTSGGKFIRTFINNLEFTEIVGHGDNPTDENSLFVLSALNPSESNPDALIVKLESDTDYVLISN